MTAHNVLVLMISAFFVLALLLIYNGYDNPSPESGVKLPATVEPK